MIVATSVSYAIRKPRVKRKQQGHFLTYAAYKVIQRLYASVAGVRVKCSCPLNLVVTHCQVQMRQQRRPHVVVAAVQLHRQVPRVQIEVRRVMDGDVYGQRQGLARPAEHVHRLNGRRIAQTVQTDQLRGHVELDGIQCDGSDAHVGNCAGLAHKAEAGLRLLRQVDIESREVLSIELIRELCLEIRNLYRELLAWL